MPDDVDSTMETLSQAMVRLAAIGYTENYHAADGQIVCGRCDQRFDPAQVEVDEIVRFEGASDPDDESILYAIDAGCGHRGLYSTAYGPSASTDDIAVLDALPDVTR